MSGYTAASILLFTSATMVDNKIDSLPDPSILFRSVIMPEIRKQELAPLISVFTRNRTGVGEFKLNTCDPDQSNRRRARTQVCFHSCLL